MRFPGKRKTRHYFPVHEKNSHALSRENREREKGEYSPYIIGLEQLIIDVEIEVSEKDFLELNLRKGQSSVVEDELVNHWYQKFKVNRQIVGEFAGGSTGNTLHNYSTLSDSRSIILGCINEHIQLGDYSFKYIRQTSSKVDMSYLSPQGKPIGRALCFITPDFERTFAISKGCMNDYEASTIPEEKVKGASLVLLSAYTLRDRKAPIFKASLELAKMAYGFKIPIAFSLGSRDLVEGQRDFLIEFLRDYVTIAAMNEQEAQALTEKEDQLLSCEKLLDLTDMVLLTSGANGLYIGAHVDRKNARKTNDPLHTKSIVNYNEFEYSRGMLRKACENPIKIYNHINPFLGGPLAIQNTNGAGDVALSALMHDIVANTYHQKKIPQSPKHQSSYLTYSSISQVSKYANRVSYEVLAQNSPRLLRGLPEKEDSLEEAYWDQ